MLEEELEARFAAAGPLPPGAAAAAARASADAPHVMRRLYQANLPASELGRCRELLRKLAAIDAAREAAAEVSPPARLSQQPWARLQLSPPRQ